MKSERSGGFLQCVFARFPSPSLREGKMGGLNNRNSRQKYLLRAKARQWFSKWGPQTNGISITWELVRRANSQAPAPTYWIRTWGWSPAICVLTGPSICSGIGQHWEPLILGVELQRGVGKQSVKGEDKIMRQDWEQTECRALRWQQANFAV